ncbi:CHAT domain-containing protein [Nocardiopsis sp. NPDC007018]|uniref:CHAT domain-containing protein n=1 Tax=Nocardiopsis sp. NPDC007018 TaxID=3155721 RepID=UPI0033E88ED3
MLPSATPAPATPGTPPVAGPPFPATGRALLDQVTQGVRLARTGRFEETVLLIDDTRRRLRGHPVAELDPVVPGVLTDLGLAQTLCGRFGPAEDHLNEARSLADARRLPLLALVARHNLGCLDLHRGDPAAAIATFRALAPHMPADRQGPLRVDLAEALLAAGLVEEAGRALAEAPWGSDQDGVARVLVQAKLRLMEGDPTGALHLAHRVRAELGPGSLWFGLADRVERAARGATRARPPAHRARDLLELRLPAVSDPSPPGALGSFRALADARRALDRLDRHGGTAPGPWLGAAGHDPHVLRAGLEGCLVSGDPATALEWAELGRTWADRFVPAPESASAPSMTGPTGRYRRALDHGSEEEARRQARIWESEHWRASSDGLEARGHRRPVLDTLLGRLDGRAFVHYTVAGSESVALVAVSGRVHARTLGPLVRLRRALGRFSHERTAPPYGRSSAVAGPPGPPAVGVVPAPRSENSGAFARSADEHLSSLLLDPVLPLVGDRPLVVTADPYLGDLPWGLLPGMRQRPVRLVSTALAWAGRPGTRPGWDRVLLVCGPEPRSARLEVADLAEAHPGARVLVGAGRERVLDALAHCDLAHLAGHGRVGDRTPMLAWFDLRGGPLLACDLTALPAAPALAVLSSCWGGRGFGETPGRPGGFVGALLARGTRTVIASPVPVDDERTGPAMRAFHRALTGGAEVSEAVARHLGHLGFCCYGP